MNVKAILVALAMVATVGTVLAQVSKTETAKEGTKACCMDAKKDKACKMDANKTCKMEAGKTCEKGAKCDMKDGKCANFVDANKNGTCDHKEAKK